MTTDPNAWIFEDSNASVSANADPNAWIFEDEPAPAPEQPKEEPTIWGKAGQVLRSGMSNVSAFSPVMGLATEIVSPQNPDDTVGAAALRGLGQGGLAIGQAASGLVTSLPGTMLKSHPVDKIREMTAPYASDQVDKTWQGMPRPQGQDALSEAVTKFAGEVGEGTADLLRGPVADKLLEIGKENAQEYERWGKEIHATVPEYRRGKDFIHDPALLLNPEYMIEGGISAAVSMVPPILAAMGTGGSALVAGTVGGMMEGLPFLQELLDKGTMPEEALVRSGAYAASSAALNAFSFGKMLDVGVMDALKVRGAKIIAAAGWEGFTEWLEGPVQALAEHVGDLPMVKKDSTLGADAMQGLGKAFSEQDPASLMEALTKSGREEAAVIPGAIMAGGGMSSVNQFSAPEHGESAPPANRDTFAVDEERPLDILNFSIDEQRAGDDPVLDGKRVGLMNALTGLQAQGLAQDAIPTTPDQQVIAEQTGLSRPPARPEGYYEQPIIGSEQIQEFEQGLAAQPGPVENYPVENLEAEWQARKADQDAMNEQARLEAEWKARGGPDVQAPAIQSDIDQKAHEAASSPLNDRSAPTKEQEKAGNYKKGHAFVNGLDISIENPAGSTRSGTDQDGNEWSTEMRNHYGYIKGTQGADKDHVDVFLGPDPKGAPSVFVVDQVNPDTGKFDEHKAMIGFESADQAQEAYLSNYQEGWRGLGAITEMPFAEFKKWAKSKKAKKPVGDISKADRPSAETVMAPVQAEASPQKPTVEEIKAKVRADINAAMPPADALPSDNPYTLSDISEKAFVVTGDTRPIKDRLKSLGGLWNRKHGGWVFSKKKREKVQAALGMTGKASQDSNDHVRKAEELAAQYERDGRTRSEFIEEAPLKLGWIYRNSAGALQESSGNDAVRNAFKDAGYSRPGSIAEVWDKAVTPKGDKDTVGNVLAVLGGLEGTSVEITKAQDGYSVIVRDDDTGKTAGVVYQYKDYDKAKQAANAISQGMDPKSENVPGTLGRNRAGRVVGEDANGVRYFIRGNVRVEQPVGIIPGKGYQIDTPERLFALGGSKLDFLTTEEIARFDQQEEGGQPGQTPDTSDLSRDDYADLFDEELAAATAPKPKKPLVKRTAEERAQDAAPKAPKEKKPLVKKPKDQMSDAAKKMADGAAAALNVFSKYGGLSIRVLKEGDEINQDLYRELKPHLLQVLEGAREMGHAGKDLAREVVRFLIKAFGEKAAQAKPYFMRFVDEEILAADTKEQEDGTSPQGPGNVEVLEGQADLDDGQRTGPDGTDVQDSKDADDLSGRSGSTGGSLGDAPAQGGDAGGRGEGNSNVDGGADSGGRTRKPTSGRKAKNDSDLGGQAPRQNARNHRVEPDDILVPGGTVARAKANIAAIRLVKKLQEENRDATPEEKQVLQQFTGWGSLAQEVFKPEHDRAAVYEARSGQPFYSSYHAGAYAEAFSKWKEKYGKHLHPALGGLMTQEEWDAAKDSTLNAHYTDRPVIEAMWKMVERMGFTGGRVLEPSAGTGLFFGLMPKSLAAKSKLTGVELDSLTGAILEKLYPDADIQVTGFETAKRVGDNTLDLVISNFPFGSFKVFDKARPQYSKQSIHNYFFSRSIDAVRPGGMVVAITSHFTLDAGSSGKLREEWAKKADFVGAVRLPGTAFEKNAGTQVTTDILIFRKKTGDSFTSEPFRHLAEIETPQGKTQINEYFVNNPDMVLGKHSLQGTMYGGENEYTVIPGSEPIAEGLAKATKRLPADVFGRGQAKGEQADTANKEAAEKAQREGTMVEKDGKVFLVENGFLTAPKWSEPKKKQAKDYVGVKRVTLELIDAMSKIDDDAEVAKVRDKLNKVYDAYVKKHGTINKKGNKFLEDDLEFPTVAALEIVTMVPVEKVRTSGANKGQTYTTMEPSVQKADIFTKRTVFPFREPTTAESLEDAIKISRVYRNGIDVDYVAELLKTTPGVARDQLIESRAAFENPETGLLEPRDLYLSGNVKAKLNIAKAAMAGNPAYNVNVEALEAVQPADLPIDAIRVRLGSYWLPTEIVERFLKHLGVRHASVARTRVEGTEGSTQWDVGGLLSAETQKWGTEGADVRYLVLDSLNLKRTVVYDEVATDDGKTKKVKNPQESLAAQEKQRVIQDEFRKWVLQDEAASRQIESLYNEKFNGHVARKFEVPDITYYPGASHTIALRENQKVGVARALQESTLLAHGVGSGKTFLQITLAMEMRRLGTAKKPWIVVQGSTLSQFAASFKALYPGARILAPTEGQRTAKNRQRLLAQIASGDWDAIITPHGFFNSVSIDPENETRFIMEQIAEFEDMIMADFDTSGMSERQLEMNPTVKAIRRKIKAMRARLEKLANNRKDANIFFENLGVDALIIDEAHAYKRGEFYTKMDNVKGLDRDSSQRSMQMLMKSRHVQEKTGGKNVIMATGTPISNTLTEMWTMFRYIRPDLLEAFGVEQFDDFASTFADTSISQEETSTGDYKDVERFNVYVNGPELLTMWRTAADVVITEELDYIKGLPKIMGGKVQEVAVERSEELGNYIKALKAERDAWDRLSGKEKREQSHVPLVIFGRAKKAAIDLRLIDPGMPDTPGSKANTAVENIFQRWQDNHDTKATQIVFCDTFQSSDKTFNLFHDIRDKLIAKGIPASQIAIIHDFNKDEDRAKLFDKVKAGEVRVIMGTTEKLGVGVNVQDRLLAAHHLDAPPRPMDFEQRNGRIRRPGNMHPEVEILVYGTKNTLDSVTFQQLISKQKFINQVLRGEMQGRSFENPFDEVQAAFADMMAAFSGNPLAKEKMQLQSELRKLTMLKSAHDDRIYGMRNDIRGRERGIEFRKEKLVTAEKAAAFVAEHFSGGIPNRKELNQRVQDWIDKARKQIVAKVETAKTYEQWRALVSDKMTMTTEFDIGHGVKAKVAAVPVYDMGSDQVIVDRDIRTEFSCFGPHEIHSFTTSFTGGAGLMTRITNFLESVSGEPDNLKAQIKEHEENIAALKVELEKPFERQPELDAAQKRYDEVEAELAHALNEDLEAGKAELSEEGDEIDIQYQVATATTPQTVDIRAVFPWADSITEDGDGRTVVTKGKNSFAVTRVEQITPDEVAFKIQYKRAFDPKTDKIAGDYREGEIRLSRVADKWTLAHEYYHALEDMGLVNKMEQAIIGAAAKKAGYAMAPSENRAYYVQDQLAARDFNRKTPVGRILQKIADMVDSLANLFTRTARGIVRDVESGKIMETAPDGSVIGAIRYAVRTKPVPKKTVKAYKLFRVDPRQPGKLFPLFVDANTPIEIGAWLDAEPGQLTSKGKVKSKLGPLAYRPGWHAGDLPLATHIGEGGTPPTHRPSNQVWAEVEFAADVDWQEEANKRGSNESGKVVPVKAHITDQVPEDGFYRYKTNPNMTGNWMIGGAMRVNRVLSDAEVESINSAAGVADLPRKAPFDAKKHGFGGQQAAPQYALSGLPSRVKAELQPKIDYLRMKLQDKFLPLKRVQEKLIRDGWTMTDEADAYRAEELFSGKAGQRLEKFQKDKVGRLLENMKDLGVSLVELEDYLYAKYAPQRNAYIATINPDMPDGGSGHTNQWATDKLAEFARAGRTRKLEALAKVVRSIAQMQRDIIRNEGLEKDETVDDWEMGNPDYVPLKGGKEETPRTIGTGFNIKRSGTKRALGRKSPATDILAHLFAQVGDTIIRAEKAKVGRAFLKMAEQNPDAELWRVHKHLPTKRGMVSKTNMARLRQKESSLKKLLALKSIKSNTRAAATRHLADVQAAIAAGGTKQVGNVVDMSFPMKDNVLTVTLEDGSVRYVELFDDDLARVMKNLTPGQHGRVVQGIASFTRFLSMVNTSLNPEFVITNFERDLLTALVHLSGEQRTAIAKKVVKDIPSAMRGIYNQLRGDGSTDWAVWYDMFKDAGAHVSFMDLRGLDQIKKDIENMTTDSSGGAYAKGKAATMKLLDFIGDVNTTVENAVRLSAFKNLIESGTSESDAASIAKNLTVNFNRKGELGPAMNAFYMFFNAGVQGSARILFALKNRRVQKMMAAVTLLAFGLAELNVLMGGDDDDDEAKWDKHANEWTRQTNLIIMLPTGDSVKIRMPYGYNFFVALGYSLSDVRRWGMGKGGKNPAEAATFLFKAAMNAFNPMGDDSLLQMISPTVMDPFVQIATNTNFMGSPIAPEQNPWGPPKPNSQLYFRSVSKPSKVAAEFINSVTGGDKWDPGAVDISPEWIDHIYDYLTGGLGRTVRDTLSLPATLVDPDIAVRRIPFLRQVYQERDSRVDMNRFYDNVLKIDKSQAMIKEAPLADRKGFVQDHPELRLRKRAEGLKRRLSTLRKEMYRHQDAGDKVKAAEVEESMRKLVVNFNKKFNEVMSGMGR